MSLIKARPIDTLQSIISSFRQFEKKLDQLQDDVTFHGQTLSELRVMLANMSSANISPDLKPDVKRLSNKITAIPTEDDLTGSRTRRKNAIQPLPAKPTRKNFQSQKYGIKPSKEPYRLPKIATSPNIHGYKRTSRQRNRENPRKATMLRPKDSKKPRRKSPQKSV